MRCMRCVVCVCANIGAACVRVNTVLSLCTESGGVSVCVSWPVLPLRLACSLLYSVYYTCIAGGTRVLIHVGGTSVKFDYA